ncbi:MAG: RNA polymerase factor sigma-54 [Candidatus Aminicenantales bacterium]
MALKQQLHQKQVQKLILAPALQQAIKLLPLTNLELVEIIDEELSQNPMLEVAEETAEEKPEKESGETASPGETSERDSFDDNLQTEEEDAEIEAYFQQYFDEGFRSFSPEKKEAVPLENIVSKSPSLWEHLEWQANLTFFGDEEKEIARYIIGNINEDGYLQSTGEEIARAMGTDEAKVEEVREKIKGFDPVGVGSLTVQEALLTQMDYFKIEDEIARKIVREYLPLLEKSDFPQMAKELGISLEEIRPHIDVIKNLDPTPGRKYSQEKTFYVVPDIFVTKEDDELKISLNDEGMPRLRVNSYYKKMLAQAAGKNPEAYQFLKEKMKKAFWFLRSLDQRDRTIYRVAKYIVEKQKDFIEKGLEYIKPLTLIELAQEIGVHESTVGRVVANKHIMTPRGVFPLKYFFHKSLSGNFGEEVSSLRVKQRIQKLIENEDRKNPLSDIEIEEILARESFRIARRTVAKYRKQLKIPPSHVRKRKYWMEET